METVNPDALIANIEANMATFMMFWRVRKYGERDAQTIESNTRAIPRLNVLPIALIRSTIIFVLPTAAVVSFIPASFHRHVQYFILVVFASLELTNSISVGKYYDPICNAHYFGQLRGNQDD